MNAVQPSEAEIERQRQAFIQKLVEVVRRTKKPLPEAVAQAGEPQKPVAVSDAGGEGPE